MDKFTIEELKLANELCFNDTFETLLKKHLPKDDLEFWYIYHSEYRTKYKCNLLHWIFSFSRADLQDSMVIVLSNIVKDLINGTV